jgi:hypothetical protein
MHLRGRAKKVNVVRHDHVSANQPGPSLPPRIDQMFMNLFGRQDFLAALRADGEEDDDRFVRPLMQRLVNGMFAPDFHDWRDDPPEADVVRVSRSSANLSKKRGTSHGRDRARPSRSSAHLYMCSITLSPKAEHLISVAPSIRRAKSYVTRLLAIAPFNPFTIRSAASVQPM